jgi:alkylation response protein AidB-like acyl-CoA dehydrogenase
VEAESRYHPGADVLAHIASLEDTGMVGMGVSGARCGSGFGAAEEALIVVGLGRRLVAPATLATMGAMHAPIDLNERRVAAAYRRGERIVIVEDPQADLVLVRDRDCAALYELKDSTGSVDHHLWLAHLRSTTSLGEPIARFDSPQQLRLRLIDAAALAGIAEATLDMSVARVGSFDAVKRHCTNMAIAARCARDQVSFAAVAIDEEREDAALQIDSALFVAGSAALENAAKNVQIHGGAPVGVQPEPSIYLERAQLLIAIAGGLDATNRRVANTKVSD